MSLKQKKKKLDKSKARQDTSSSSDSDNESEHELSYYIEDRIKLMKQITRILRPKKIKSMAPNCYKKLDISELSSMLLEELLGISNKRLKHIISGQNNLEYSSSDTDDVEEKPIDIISLDDISTDEDLMLIENDKEDIATTLNEKSKKKKKLHIKSEHKTKKIKKEKPSSPKTSKETNLMNVLELLELQARARAIRSQLALEAENKKKEETQTSATRGKNDDDDNDSDAVILDSPKLKEIVISSSESETEQIGDVIAKCKEKAKDNKHIKLTDKNKKWNSTDAEAKSYNESRKELEKVADKEQTQCEHVVEGIVHSVEKIVDNEAENSKDGNKLNENRQNKDIEKSVAEGNQDENLLMLQNVAQQTNPSEKDSVQNIRKANDSDNEEEVVLLNIDAERDEVEREISTS